MAQTQQPANTQGTTQPSQAQPSQPVAAQPQSTGQPEVKTSVWKKWWFWLIIVLGLVIAGGAAYLFIFQ